MAAVLARLAAAAPPAACAATAVLLVVQSLSAGGAADQAGIASWAPTAAGLVMALPVLGIALAGTLFAARRARGAFHLDPLATGVGVMGYSLAAAFVVFFAAGVGSADSYEPLAAESTTTGGFVMIAVVAAIIASVLLAGVTAAYIIGIEPGPRRGRLNDVPERRDFLAHWAGRRR